MLLLLLLVRKSSASVDGNLVNVVSPSILGNLVSDANAVSMLGSLERENAGISACSRSNELHASLSRLGGWAPSPIFGEVDVALHA